MSEQEGNSEFNIGQIIRQVASRWYWFVLTVPLFVGLAYWKNLQSKPIHSIQAKILVEVKRDRVVVGDNTMNGLDHLFRSKTVNNEIEVLRSRDLIGRALDSLRFNVAYFFESDLKQEVYPEQIPFEVRADFSKAERLNGSPLKLVPKSADTFDIWFGEEHAGTFQKGQIISHKGFSLIIDRKYNTDLREELQEPVVFYINSPDALINSYMRRLTAMESDKDTDAIILGIEELMPEKGKAFLNELLKCYFLQVLEERKRIAESAYDFIDDRVNQNFAHLDSVETAIDKYKRERNLTDPSLESKYILEAIKKFEIELSDAETQLKIITDLELEALTNPISELDLSVPTTMLGVTDVLLQEMLRKFNTKQYELRQMGQTVRPDNPMFLEKKTEVEDLRGSIMANLMSLKENMVITVSYITSQINQYNQDLRALSNDEKGLVAMERVRDNREGLYVYLLKKREEAAMGLASELMDTWVLERPYVIDMYHNPKKAIVLLIGAFLGVFFPLTTILLLIMFDGRVQTEQDLWEVTKLPLVGRVSKTRSSLVLNDTSSAEGMNLREEFKRACLNLKFIKDPHKVIMVTSMDAGEGKTFSAINLWLTNAALGKKVCLLELDLRRPSIVQTLGVKDQGGVVDIIMNKKRMDEVTHVIPGLENAHVLTGECLPVDPTNFLMETKLDSLIGALKTKYDMVIIDTPPIGILADARIISRFTDVNIMVVAEGKSKKSRLKEMSRFTGDESVLNLSILFNFIKSGVTTSYYLNKKKNPFQRIGFGKRKGPTLGKTKSFGEHSERK